MSIYNMISEDIKSNDINAVANITIGIVTDINDPDKLGRIKVKLTNRSTSDFETDYIRVMTPMSGAQWGMFFFPEVGDEVLVAFCDGNIHRPYVLGSLWNKERKQPQEIKDGKNDIREIKTRSGHSIKFDDTKDKENIDIKTAKGLEIKLCDKGDKESAISIKDSSGKNIIEIDGKNGSISIKAEKKISLESGSCKLILDGQGKAIKIESGGNLELKGNQAKLEGQGTVNVKANSQLTVESSGITNVKGSMVKIN